MNDKRSETIAVIVLASLFFAAFGAITYFDRPHGSVGASYGDDQVNTDVKRNLGYLTVDEMPEDLLVFGAGQEASLEFNVENMDPDNDIDTIYITIPDSSMIEGDYQWYTSQEHEWNATMPADDIMKFVAVDDIEGHEFGGSEQYDVAGNIDDALDSDGEDINEGIKLHVRFNAPTSSGIKMEEEGINLEVADEKTENANAKETFAPFPYYYVVAGEGEEYIVMINKNPDMVTLEVRYGNSNLFTSTRGSDFQATEYGFKYISSSGDEVIVLESPQDDTLVKPLVRAKDTGLTGQFTLSVFNFTLEESVLNKDAVVTDYTDDIPADPTIPLDNDIDGDGLYNNDPNELDIDGDGTINENDRDPYDSSIFNHQPTGLTASVQDKTENKVKEGEGFVLEATASDPDGDELTYTWSSSDMPSFSKSGPTINVDGLDPGDYSFTVTVDDDHGGVTEYTLNVVVEEEEEPANWWIYILIAVIVIVVIAVILFFLLKNVEEEEEEPTEMEPEEIPGIDESEYGGEELGIESDFGMESMEPPKPETSYVGDMYEETPEMEESEPPAEEEESEDTEEVEQLEQLIEDLEQTEEEIGDVCPECGASLGPEDSECPNCGAQFELALECPNCGAVVEEDMSECPNCGVQFG